MTLLFFGSDPWFSQPVLATLVEAGHNVPVVVTKGDEVANRLQTTDYGKNIKILQAKTQSDISKSRLQKAVVGSRLAVIPDRPSAIVLAAFGPPFLPDDLLDWPTYGCLNVHASLLPRWRGASPVSAAIAAGDRETGVTIMRMTKEIDRGAILGQARTTIHQPSFKRTVLAKQGPSFSEFDTRESLTRRLGVLGGELIVKTIGQISQIRPIGQSSHSPTPYTYRLKKEDGRVDWTRPPEEIERFIRAVTPWPGAWTKVQAKGQGTRPSALRLRLEEDKGQVIKILKAHLETDSSSSLLPTPYSLLPDLIQLPGKNPITWKQFLAGHPGVRLG